VITFRRARAAIESPRRRHPSATLGQAFQKSRGEPAVAEALFDVLETQRMLASNARLALLPGGAHARMLAT